MLLFIIASQPGRGVGGGVYRERANAGNRKTSLVYNESRGGIIFTRSSRLERLCLLVFKFIVHRSANIYILTYLVLKVFYFEVPRRRRAEKLSYFNRSRIQKTKQIVFVYFLSIPIS